MFSDQFMDKEENGKLFDVIIDYLTTDKVGSVFNHCTDSLIYRPRYSD